MKRCEPSTERAASEKRPSVGEPAEAVSTRTARPAVHVVPVRAVYGRARVLARRVPLRRAVSRLQRAARDQQDHHYFPTQSSSQVYTSHLFFCFKLIELLFIHLMSTIIHVLKTPKKNVGEGIISRKNRN